jgi:LAO/AO transport system kinase
LPPNYDDPRVLARAATLIENGRPEAQALLDELRSRTGRALTVGITGAPGAGKSTLLNRLIRKLRDEGQRVGVIAVDPSSTRTGGAILGDRVRMQDHHADPGVFIRSMAARGHLGGVAQTTIQLIRLLDGAGFDTVLVETVGVGQGEIEIARLAKVVVVVLVPGMGDGVQMMKAGILEIAGVFLINKADHPGANQLEAELRSSGTGSPIVKVIATEGKGVDEALAAIRAVGLEKDKERN